MRRGIEKQPLPFRDVRNGANVGSEQQVLRPIPRETRVARNQLCVETNGQGETGCIVDRVTAPRDLPG